MQWLLADPINLGDLVAFVDPALAARLDFSRAVLLPRSFMSSDLHRRESDIVCRAPLRALEPLEPGQPGDVWLILLLEHQSAPDRMMCLRLLVYLARIWEHEMRRWDDQGVSAVERHVSLVVPIVFYTGATPWETPLRISPVVTGPAELHARFVPEMEVLVLSLQEVDPSALAAHHTAMASIMHVLRKERAEYSELRRAYMDALDSLEKLPDDRAGQWLRATWYLQLLATHRRAEAEYTELREVIYDRAATSRFGLEREVVTVGQTIVERIEGEYRERVQEAQERGIRLGEERGIRRGIQLGEERGIRLGEERARLAGLRRSLLLVLRTRFGEIPEAVEAAVLDAGEARLENWTRASVTAKSLDEIGLSRRD